MRSTFAETELPGPPPASKQKAQKVCAVAVTNAVFLLTLSLEPPTKSCITFFTFLKNKNYHCALGKTKRYSHSMNSLSQLFP